MGARKIGMVIQNNLMNKNDFKNRKLPGQK
jgi:hypothetical protein